jgi:hypothetical protein
VAKSPGRERESKRKRYFYIFPPFLSAVYTWVFPPRERDTGLRPAPRLTAKSRRFTTLFGPHIPPRGFPPLFFSLSTSKKKKRKNRKEENVGIEKCYACLERKLEGKQQPRLFCFVTSRESTMDEDPTNGNQ